MSSNGTNSNKNGSEYARLDGRDFEIVKQGLDIDQVKEFVEELRGERDRLLAECDELKKREEHHKSLTRLAEKTVMEADKLAGEIRAETMQKVEAEADEMREEVKGLLLKVYDGLTEELDGIKEKVASSRATFEKSLSSSDNDSGSSPERVPPAAVESRHEEASPEATEESAPVATMTAEKEEKRKPDMDLDDRNLMSHIHDKEIQLDIMPPIDIAKVSKIITNLYDLPQVEDAELLTDSDRPSIVIMENEPIELSKLSQILSDFPQIDEANVVKSESGQSGRSRKIELVLAGNKK